ncbi:MAG: glycosyltransferase family 2 protein [Flavobacteriales bacterium]|nr:glycosyltransferase family 2 protein [Flavobacteriales bacterium]MCW8912281.1 glycosyltransferase family 2 protein [Flavobacteriales bacterium]MCW8937480.1 glycosyltransferase family 2 protein [Flavobacteriales bacterium]MCW8940665.1 glycosyltransferase family 2 protein [Flavobacteriales bacterium]MCW8967195.1 glycosyltransferase family 2 protein [Flavobacteriales bacterium]
MNEALNISVVIPLYNEEESLPELAEWIHNVLYHHHYSYEIIFVDDGSRDNSWKVIEELKAKNNRIKAIKFRRNYGKSAGLNVGFAAAQGDVVFTMDADLQDSPDELPDLYKMIVEEGYDLVSGWKKKRYDPITKTIPTKLFNAATRSMSGIKNLHDFNCGLKAYKKEVIKNIEVYGEMHRYIPVIAKWAGFEKITEKVVQHRERKYGTTKFGIERFINGFLDLLSITFMAKFSKRPMHLFGTLGTFMFLIGFLISLWLGVNKLFIDTSARLLADRAEFYLALTSMILGSLLFISGFLGELISRSSVHRNKYQIEKEI